MKFLDKAKQVVGGVAKGIKSDYNKLHEALDPKQAMPATEQIKENIKKNIEDAKQKVKGVVSHHSAEDGSFLATRKKKFLGGKR